VAGAAGIWRAKDLAGLADGDPISTWPDTSGNGKDLTGSGTARPTYKTNIYNGWPVVRFDGTDDLLVNAAFTALIGAAGCWGFATVIITNGVVEHRLIDRTSQIDWRMRTDASNDDIGFGLQTSAGFTVLRTPTTGMSYGVPQRIIWAYDGTNNWIRREGTQEATAAKTGTISNGSGDLKVGNVFNHDLLELGIYASAPTGSNITDTETYMAGEYAAATAAGPPPLIQHALRLIGR
jgi:hypothetical protein